MKVILIDSGTTNSRIRLVNTELTCIIDQIKIKLGVRNTAINGNNKSLKLHLKEGIKQIILANNLNQKDIGYIVASGMITSNLGLFELPHICGPAGLEEFVVNSRIIETEDFFNIPCIYVPGMKNCVSEQESVKLDIDKYDVMRGEEVETIGLLKQFDLQGRGIMVLPGSHTKYVAIDEQKKLTSCMSTLGGEVLLAVQKETILSSSLSNNLIEEIDNEMLIKGYESAKSLGLTRSFYHVRLFQIFSDLTENKRANYFTGAVMHDDILSLLHFVKKERVSWVVVGGSNPLKGAFVHLLKYLDLNWKVIEASEEQVEYSMVKGAMEIATNFMKNYRNNSII